MKNECKPNHIILYWSDELPAEHIAPLRRHIEMCSNCQALLADLEEIDTRISEIPLPAPTRQGPSSTTRHTSYWHRNVFAVAAALLISVGGWLVFRTQHGSQCAEILSNRKMVATPDCCKQVRNQDQYKDVACTREKVAGGVGWITRPLPVSRKKGQNDEKKIRKVDERPATDRNGHSNMGRRRRGYS